MAVSTLIYSVQTDEIKQQSLVEQDRRQVYGAIILVAIAIGPGVFLVENLIGTVAWRSFLAEALSLCLYAAVAVWYGLRHRPKVAWRVALAVYVIGLGIMGLVDYLAKQGQSVLLVDSTLTGESILFWIGSLMVCFVPLLGWVVWRYPREMRQVGLYFGLSRSRLLRYIGGGLGIGFLVCLHFWLTTRAIGMEMDVKPWPYMAWQFFYEIGPQSLPEELFMRGVVFNELYFGRSWNFWIAALATSGLELLSLLVKQDYSTDVIMIVGVIFYTVVSSVASAGLFRWSRNVIPGYVNNVFFGVVSMFR
jgi:hypothetical protein